MLHRLDRGYSKWKSLTAALPSARGVLLAAQSFGGAEIRGIRPVGEQDRNRAGGQGSRGRKAGGVAPQAVRRCWKEMRPLGAGWMSAREAQPSQLAPHLVSSTESASCHVCDASSWLQVTQTQQEGASSRSARLVGHTGLHLGEGTGAPPTASGLCLWPAGRSSHPWQVGRLCTAGTCCPASCPALVPVLPCDDPGRPQLGLQPG